MDRYNALVRELDHREAAVRLSALRRLRDMILDGSREVPRKDVVTNNHIHTKYSFSPYSPAKAAWMGYQSGLATVGIIDHDTVAGVGEFIEAGEILSIPATIGFEIRTDWTGTPIGHRRINNPDQSGCAYITAHGIPHQKIGVADAFLQGVRIARDRRNRVMTGNINAITASHGIALDYECDILPLSCADEGGTVTERHLLFALSLKIIDILGKGRGLIDFLEQGLGIPLNEKQRRYLSDTGCELYPYDLLNVLKGAFVKQIYADASAFETPPVREAVAFIKSIGAIPAYCYLGDVGASPTGDKAAQAFEDEYLDDLFPLIADLGFGAVAFMPSRNTPEQLARVMALCREYGLMQISGEDINQPRQSFVCEELKSPEYRHLIDTTWALIGHERAATARIGDGMFYNKTAGNELDGIIKKYMNIGKNGLPESMEEI